jgi:multidrug efflux pump subunit AcrB
VKGAIAWFARNPVAANILLMLLVAGGLLTAPRIKQEIFPEVDTDLVTVTVEYPNASPEEVEEAICVRVEEEIHGVDGIKRLRSTATEGVGVVTAELYDDADGRRVLHDVKNRIDAIDTFPVEAEEPIVEKVVQRFPVINVAVWGDADERTLKVLGQQVRDELTAIPGITHAELIAARPYEIAIEVSEQALRRHGLTFDDLARAVGRSSLDLPGGIIKGAGGEVLLRTKGQAYRGVEFEELPLVVRPDGTRVLVRDVAAVVDGFEDTDQQARFDGHPAVLVQVFRVGVQSAPDVSRAVHAYVREAQPRMPAGITLTTWQDDNVLLESRRDLLLRNGLQGFALVVLVLALFLRPSVAFWVAAGVPAALLGTLWLLPTLDVSVNMVSLFAFILVLGILVDDAIVTGENIHTHQTRDPDPVRAAIRGTQEVSTPVTFGVLTTVAAFTPMLLLPGIFGRLSRTIPLVVITALLFSLVEAKLVLPAHLAHRRRARDGTPRGGVLGTLGRLHAGVGAGLEAFVRGAYQPFLDRCLAWRGLTLAVAVALLVLTFGYAAAGHLRFSFFPQLEGDHVVAYLTMPQGTPAEVTAGAVARLERAADEIRRELEAEGGRAFRHVLATVGEQPFRGRQESGMMAAGQAARGGHLGEVNVQLVESEHRAILSEEIARRWRERTGAVPDAVELVFNAALLSTGKPIDVQLRGSDVEALRHAARAVAARLAGYAGVLDIADSFRAGKQELKLAIRPEAEALGLSLADLARQVRQAFYGEEVQRIQRGRDDVRVMVRYPAADRRSLGDLEDMRIRLPDGTAVPFAAVARVELGRGYSTIRRTDRQRVIDVTAEVDLGVANPNEILADLRAAALPQVLAEHPGVGYALEGEQREQAETLATIRRYSLLSLIAIFALLAVPLRSYAQPFLIMTAIPFGIVGALWGHVLTGRDLSILSIIGIVALSGVVVNDSLVLVDWVNGRHREGVPVREAVRRAGAARFRAVLLTSLTTFAGLTPIMLEDSVQARFLIPMAVSLAFGVLFATAVTLVLVPAAYLALEDLRALGGRAAAALGVGRALAPERR